MSFSQMSPQELLAKADELQQLVELLRTEAKIHQSGVWISPRGHDYHNDKKCSKTNSAGKLVPVARELAMELWRQECDHCRPS